MCCTKWAAMLAVAPGQSAGSPAGNASVARRAQPVGRAYAGSKTIDPRFPNAMARGIRHAGALRTAH